MNRVEIVLAELDKARSGKLGSLGGYELSLREINAVREHTQIPHDAYCFGLDMFLLGFVRGRRCEKSAQKRKKAQA